jgi:hypothetical protein
MLLLFINVIASSKSRRKLKYARLLDKVPLELSNGNASNIFTKESYSSGIRLGSDFQL